MRARNQNPYLDLEIDEDDWCAPDSSFFWQEKAFRLREGPHRPWQYPNLMDSIGCSYNLFAGKHRSPFTPVSDEDLAAEMARLPSSKNTVGLDALCCASNHVAHFRISDNAKMRCGRVCVTAKPFIDRLPESICLGCFPSDDEKVAVRDSIDEAIFLVGIREERRLEQKKKAADLTATETKRAKELALLIHETNKAKKAGPVKPKAEKKPLVRTRVINLIQEEQYRRVTIRQKMAIVAAKIEKQRQERAAGIFQRMDNAAFKNGDKAQLPTGEILTVDFTGVAGWVYFINDSRSMPEAELTKVIEEIQSDLTP